MPAFGYMLLLNDNVHQYLTIKYDGWLLNYLPSVWRVWLLFYGSFFLATAAVTYSFFCPPYVKEFPSPFELAESLTPHMLRHDCGSGLILGLTALYARMSQWERSLTNLEPFDFEEQPASKDDAFRQISNALFQIWTIQDVWHPRLRMFLLVMFAVGLALLAIPAVFTFVQVTFLFLKRLTS